MYKPKTKNPQMMIGGVVNGPTECYFDSAVDNK